MINQPQQQPEYTMNPQKIKELNEQRGAKYKDLVALSEKGTLTADENQRFATLETEIRGIDEQLTRGAKALSLASSRPVDLSKGDERDIGKFHWGRLLRSMANPNIKLEGIEAEMVDQGEKEWRESDSASAGGGGIHLPRALTRRMDRRSIPLVGEREARDWSATGTTSTTGDQGGMTVATTPMGLLDAFYSRLVFGPAGATIMEGLRGNVNFPRYVKDTDPSFKSENAALDKLNPTTAMLSLTPHRVGAFELISEQLLMQSSATIEAVLRNNLIRQVAAKVQASHINGGGGSDLTGILGTSGVGAVYAGGQKSSGDATDTISSTNADGTTQVFADWVKLETAIADVDGDWGEMAYITNPKVIGQAKRTRRGLAYPGDTTPTDGKMIIDSDSSQQVNGYRFFRTTSVPKTLSKGASSGILSALMFGVWADDYIGFWSSINIELLRDATLARTGQYQLTAAVYVDGGLVRPAAFAFCKDIKA